jgi:hypothetical protein
MDRQLLFEKKGRRSGTDRRKFSYAVHIPERRSGKDRRENLDRSDKQAKHIIPIKEKDPAQEKAVY